MKHIAAFLFLLAQAIVASAQTPVPEMIQDIHVPVAHSFDDTDGPYCNVQGKVIFSGRTTVGEWGIWSFDGHIATMIEDNISGFESLAEADDGFFFVDAYDNGKYWLLKHDGSPGVSRLLDDFTSVPLTEIIEIAALHDKVFYPKIEPATGLELWCATGTPGSGYLLKDCSPGPGGSKPFEFAVTDSLVFFRAGSAGKQLWRTDGTSDGTFLLLETNISEKRICNNSLRIIGNQLYFLIQNPLTYSTELWKSGGTPATTMKTTDVPPATTWWETRAVTMGTKYIYTAYDYENEGLEWAISDGTAAGTELLFDISQSDSYCIPIFNKDVRPILNNEFYFFYYNHDESEIELWKSDGTAAGTIKIKSMGDTYNAISLPATKQFFYFLTHKYNEDVELWASDGTETNTQIVKILGKEEFLFNDFPMSATDSTVCFQTPIYETGLPRLMVRSDGTEQGTYFLNGIPAPWLEGSKPSGFTAGPNDAIFFRANIEYTQESIWKSDAVPPFTASLLDSVATTYFQILDNPKSSSEQVFWFIRDTLLSVSDTSGTIIQIPLPVSYDGNYQWSQSTLKEDILYFLVDNGNAIWRSDGSADGTFEVFSAPANSKFYGLMNAGDSLFFVQRNTSPSLPMKQHLWTTDGTGTGTLNLGETSDNGSTLFLLDVNGRLAYKVYDSNPDTITIYVRGFPLITLPGSAVYEFRGLEIIDDQLFILGPPIYNGTSIGYSLWIFQNNQLDLLHTFASVVGYDIYSLFYYEDRLHGLGENVIFGAGLTNNNVELWTSDGTPAGTSEIRDINPAGSSDPDNFVRFDDDHWLFTAFDGTTTAWWATDGTWDGTFKVADLAIGSNYLVPNVENAYLYQNRLYFSMNDGLHGQEPWVIMLGDSLTVGAIMPLQPASGLALWPNPASDMLFLSVETATNKDVSVEISNNLGEVVYRQQATIPAGTPIAIPLDKRLVAGVYVVRVSTKEGKSWVKKFVLSR